MPDKGAQDLRQHPSYLMKGDQQMKHVNFQNGTIQMAGNLYLPEGFSEGKKYTAIVCVQALPTLFAPTLRVPLRPAARRSSQRKAAV
jgi:hypothetical protein